MSITNPDDLLAQVAAGLQSDCDAEVIAEAAELAEAERARVRLVDRWSATSNPISIWSVGLPALSGTVVAASATVVVVVTSSWNLWALSADAVVCVAGLAAGLRDDGPDRVIPVQITWISSAVVRANWARASPLRLRHLQRCRLLPEGMGFHEILSERIHPSYVGLQLTGLHPPLAPATDLDRRQLTGANQCIGLCGRNIKCIGDIGQGKEALRHGPMVPKFPAHPNYFRCTCG